MRLFLALSIFGCTNAPSVPLQTADVTRGGAVYENYCAACHQADGSGQPGKDVVIAASFKGESSPLDQTDAALIRAIKYGKSGKIGAMPPWAGVLSEQQLIDVLAYLRHTFGGEPQEPTPEE
jgi:cytochrome c oxidase subunit 2